MKKNQFEGQWGMVRYYYAMICDIIDKGNKSNVCEEIINSGEGVVYGKGSHKPIRAMKLFFIFNGWGQP